MVFEPWFEREVVHGAQRSGRGEGEGIEWSVNDRIDSCHFKMRIRQQSASRSYVGTLALWNIALKADPSLEALALHAFGQTLLLS